MDPVDLLTMFEAVTLPVAQGIYWCIGMVMVLSAWTAGFLIVLYSIINLLALLLFFCTSLYELTISIFRQLFTTKTSRSVDDLPHKNNEGVCTPDGVVRCRELCITKTYLIGEKIEPRMLETYYDRMRDLKLENDEATVIFDGNTTIKAKGHLQRTEYNHKQENITS